MQNVIILNFKNVCITRKNYRSQARSNPFLFLLHFIYMRSIFVELAVIFPTNAQKTKPNKTPIKQTNKQTNKDTNKQTKTNKQKKNKKNSPIPKLKKKNPPNKTKQNKATLY
ncbi:hypothetical protein CHS0354_007656 [Potamilus streckersoni]|uniref:Uncharacterized protein n=1 Tax=Potamilus streckersoni TaxID=2493646 RepID=A0AAE0SH22_9BIVA|nr:hypothetical protein CHS0354_007656 [Potamilus streckersoni]